MGPGPKAAEQNEDSENVSESWIRFSLGRENGPWSWKSRKNYENFDFAGVFSRAHRQLGQMLDTIFVALSVLYKP